MPHMTHAVPRSWWLERCSVADVPLATPDAVEGASADVVVVGLGASGLEAVVELAARGVDVIGLDAVGIAGGAAGANGGFLLAGMADFHHDAVARHGRDTAVDWWRRTAAEMDRLADVEPTFRRVGSLRIAATTAEEADCTAELRAMRADGIPAEPYDGPEGRGLLVPGDGAVDPVARCRRLAAAAVLAGARLLAPARVTAIRLPGGGADPGTATAPAGRAAASITIGIAASAVLGDAAVRDDLAQAVPVRAGGLRARAVLVAVDGGLERIAVTRGGAAPEPLAPTVRTVRLQMLATAREPALTLSRPVYRRHGYDYVQQLPTGEILLGGGRDLGGEEEWAAAPKGRAHPSDRVQAHLDGWLADLGVSAAVTHRWAAHAGFTDDRLPVDTTPAPGVHVIGGYSGQGNVIGGLLGRAAASRILDPR